MVPHIPIALNSLCPLSRHVGFSSTDVESSHSGLPHRRDRVAGLRGEKGEVRSMKLRKARNDSQASSVRPSLFILCPFLQNRHHRIAWPALSCFARRNPDFIHGRQGFTRRTGCLMRYTPGFNRCTWGSPSPRRSTPGVQELSPRTRTIIFPPSGLCQEKNEKSQSAVSYQLLNGNRLS